MPFQLMALPYADDALEPHMSADTLRFHHGKHHQAYVETLNKLIEGKSLARLSLEDIIRESAGAKSTDMKEIFNNAGQVWNHDFYWNCMRPGGGGSAEGELARRIDAAFGSLEALEERFKQAAVDQFGSGWVWLVLDGDDLEIMTPPNAELPMVHRRTALLTCDVWEHAYYLDYQNQRPAFVERFLDHLVNWEFVASRLESAVGEDRLDRPHTERKRA
jgi:Fe-Mn family superoxide dismutase